MLHVVFNSSGAGSLRQALSNQGLRQRVVDLTDHLDWGPIASNNFGERQTWLDHNIPLQGSGWDWIASSAVEFAEKVRRETEHLVWIAPQSASELCGLYWYLDLIGGSSAAMIVVDYPLDGAWRGKPPGSLGELNEDRFSDLLSKAEREPWNLARFPSDTWNALRADASLLRIAENGQIKSAREDHFDAELLAQCSFEWQNLNRITGETMVSLWDRDHNLDDLFLCWRLRVLAKQGRIASNREIAGYAQSRLDPVLIRLTGE